MKFLKIALLLLAALAAYLLLWPTGMDPVAWTPRPVPALEGDYAYNEKLKGIQRLVEGVGVGPEGINVDAVGQVYAGYRDGRVIRMAPGGGPYTEIVNTGGRPLGISFGPKGGIVIADALKGLLHQGRGLTVLATEADGLRFGFPDDVDSANFDKNVYFTDASWKFGMHNYIKDYLEHGANGRLLQYNVVTKELRVLLKDLHFANGVAVGPDDEYVLVNETAEYRVRRYWLKGEKTGTSDIFIDNLPGFPDNISFNGRDRFWLALYGVRDQKLEEQLSGSFFVRKLIARLPGWVQPRPKKHSFVLGLDFDGKVVANLQYAGDDAYAPITSVREFGPWLYFGSLSETAIGRLPLAHALAGAALPPAGWEQVPDAREQARTRTRKDIEEEHEAEERRERAEVGEERD